MNENIYKLLNNTKNKNDLNDKPLTEKDTERIMRRFCIRNKLAKHIEKRHKTVN